MNGLAYTKMLEEHAAMLAEQRRRILAMKKSGAATEMSQPVVALFGSRGMMPRQVEKPFRDLQEF